MHRLRILGVLAAVAAASASVGLFSAHSQTNGPQADNTPDSYNAALSCGNNIRLCTEVADPMAAFGHYVGHDEPSVLWYSNAAGSGNQAQYTLTMPKEPNGGFDTNHGYSMEVTPAFWFGMAMCDTQSYPEQTNTCTPDSDSNIVDPGSPGSYTHAPGAAFMELQFYPPGFAQQFAGSSCDATRWCVALNIDSLAEDPINGTTLNDTCVGHIGGSPEYVNFAYLTLSGSPLGPPNPVNFDFTNSGDPQPVAGRGSNDTLFINQGDSVTVNMHDTAHGLTTIVTDNTTHTTGSMTASAANGFGQIQYDPNPGTTCNNIPYDFHPMYSTSSPQTRVLWAAHSYNVSMDEETGHFDFCTHIDADTGLCNGLEGPQNDQEPADGDFGCFSMAENTNFSYIPDKDKPQAYCTGTNDPGFDGTPYHEQYWPTGGGDRATSELFSSPLTGAGYTTPYAQAALEADMPRLEASDFGGACDRTNGHGCTNPPITDDGQPVAFYPYFSAVQPDHTPKGSCVWAIGSKYDHTVTNFGGSAQWGPLLFLNYWRYGGHGSVSANHYNDYNSGPFANPC